MIFVARARRRSAWSLPALVLLGGCIAKLDGPAPFPPHARYVAMGSSFAAGPGITAPAEMPATRCGRSVDNYAHQLARRRSLTLVDVSCGGATTANLLGPWAELPPQVDALTADTRLVTVTIGGNDVNYIAGLMIASCPDDPEARRPCRPFPQADEATWVGLQTRLEAFAREVRLRAPDARLIFVNYLTLLPPHGTCAATPLTDPDADKARALAARLAVLTATVAARNGAGLVDAAALSRGHDACSARPWSNGSPRPLRGIVPYHPVLAGMTALAEALDRELRKNPPKTGNRRPL